MKIKKILIANRGEIAVRILRTLKKMDIKSIAVHSIPDTSAMHVSFADESVCIGPAEAAKSYNCIRNIIAAAELTEADAIHPGYGFLSEDAEFAKIVEQHGIIFIGPTGEQIEQFGNKISAKTIFAKGGVPTISGSDAIEDVDIACELSHKLEYPVLLKATDCGGGRGQRIVHDKHQFRELFLAAQSEAEAISGIKTIYIEKYFENARHIEFQIIGDGKGIVICLGTRDCSLQRRHQKILEEAPANISKKMYDNLSYKICKILGKYKYRNAGTVEFLESAGKLYFIEMNTRLQVEHPVTELITGIDLVELQIRTAAGEKLPKQKTITFSGHAIESRITSEDSFTFTPCPGKIEQFLAPGGPYVRVDSALYPGWIISPWYDSLIAKIISKGATREECIKNHTQALRELSISGIKNSSDLHIWLMNQQDFLKNDFSTRWLEKAIAKVIG